MSAWMGEYAPIKPEVTCAPAPLGIQEWTVKQVSTFIIIIIGMGSIIVPPADFARYLKNLGMEQSEIDLVTTHIQHKMFSMASQIT